MSARRLAVGHGGVVVGALSERLGFPEPACSTVTPTVPYPPMLKPPPKPTAFVNLGRGLIEGWGRKAKTGEIA